MDEVVRANYRPADNNIDAAIDNFALMEKMVSGLFVTSLINVKSNTTQPYTCVDCAVPARANSCTVPLSCLASLRFHSWPRLAMIHAATFLLTNKKGLDPVSNSA